jgi:hypothetical protein
MQKTCRLALTLTYDDQLTHPDGLATAMDMLLETALSTPEIMADYGPVTVSSFEVLPES